MNWTSRPTGSMEKWCMFLQDLDNVNKLNLASVDSVDYVYAEES